MSRLRGYILLYFENYLIMNFLWHLLMSLMLMFRDMLILHGKLLLLFGVTFIGAKTGSFGPFLITLRVLNGNIFFVGHYSPKGYNKINNDLEH
jgi:hypothetical protein